MTTTLVTHTGTAVALYTTKPYGNLTLDVGETRHRVRPHLRVTGAEWSSDAPATLLVKGRCTLASRPQGALAIVAEGPDGTAERTPVEPAPSGGTFTARIPCTTPGERELTLRLTTATGKWSVPVPPQPSLKAARWRRLGLPWYAKPLPGRDALTLRVGRVELLKAVHRRLTKR
ncbi:hypothetical protein [Streptomyces roseoverticillatus]|uniref:Uncharacterized protein n=1 Tax=Streptomyces roseoverticillatus TaxID=66429 RepID=A0ABV3J1C1_9ACTN